MDKNKIILNGIFYLIITIIFIILFIKEKSIGEWVRIRRDAFADRLVTRLGFDGFPFGTFIKKAIAVLESLGTAVILVLIIQHVYLGNFVVPTGSMIPTIEPKDRLFGNMVVYKFSKPEREDIVVFKEPIQNKVLYTKRVMGLPGEKVAIKDHHLYVNDEMIKEREYLAMGALGAADYWIVPKKGDTVEVIPGSDYKEVMRERNIDVDKVQKYLLKNPGAVEQLLPDLKFTVNGVPTGMILDVIHNKKYLKDILAGQKLTLKLDEDYYLTLGDNTANSFDSRMWGFVKESRIRGKAFVRFWPLNRISLIK
ncbi:signal peptidase I [Fusobacterium sp.]|uniref:signal peptidase I n=1 Tax=Fusobacterium sp. TaxID=68766 RepID=UPI00396CB51C